MDVRWSLLMRYDVAIGDGANDVPMIQAGNVGVGIAGKEGTHAAAASDFKVGQFKFLAPLLLIHGRMGYIRISKAITLTFYANMLFTCTAFLYNFVCDYSGFPAYNVAQYALFQAFIAIPAFALGWFDRDVKDVYSLLNYPRAYDVGRLNRLLYPAFVDVQILRAILHALRIFFVITAEDLDIYVVQFRATLMLLTTLVLVFFSIWDSGCITVFHIISSLLNVVILLVVTFINSANLAFLRQVFGNDTIAKVFICLALVILIDYSLQALYYGLNQVRGTQKYRKMRTVAWLWPSAS